MRKKRIVAVLTVLLWVLTCQHVFAEEETRMYRLGRDNIQVNCDGVDADVSCVIADTEGKRIGYDLRTEAEYREIEGTWGLSGSYCHDCEYREGVEAIFNLIDGEYTVEFIGEGLTEYFVDAGISSRTRNDWKTTRVHGVIDEGKSSVVKFTFSSEPDKPLAGLFRTSTPQSLKQDITLSRKIGWIDNDGIMKSLLKKAEAAEESIERGNTRAAENELKALINEVEAQTEKHISKEASTILIEDAQYIIDNL